MKLPEVLAASRAGITKRFTKSLGYYARGYSGLDKTFRDFCQSKSQGLKYGKKDIPFLGNPQLRGFMHAHLVHGKVIVVYRVRNGTLFLYDIVEHNSVECGRELQKLTTYMLSVEDFKFEDLKIAA